jgi:23S rRNA (adenine2503-C2)-methyltransferase
MKDLSKTTYITSLNLAQLRELVKNLGWEPYRADQILNWVYKKFVTNFEEMTNLSKEQRRFLSDNYSIHSLELVQKVEGGDSHKVFV